MSNDATTRSSLKEFLTSISAISGDLSNITAPPFVLATQSTTEYPSYWALHRSHFLAPASEPDSSKRCLLVLMWFLTSLKAQQYGGRDPEAGIKKPLNAFLGELYLASDDEDGTQLIAEQVSHHPPITACYLRNERAGISAEGFASQEITFNIRTGVHVHQTGHAILHLDAYDEDYLIPLPDIKIKGILTGSPYPELEGRHAILGSSGWVAEMEFSGKGFLGKGDKSSVHAVVYKQDEPTDSRSTTKEQQPNPEPLYTVTGQWTKELTIHTGPSTGPILQTINISTLEASPLQPPPIDQQSPWESGKAWNGVITALHAGNMSQTVVEKSRLENAQREMRRREKGQGIKWEPLFFKKIDGIGNETVLESLITRAASGRKGGKGKEDETGKRTGKERWYSIQSGIWRFKREKSNNGGVEKPYHGDLKPA